jgi:hypothetical protein
MGNTGAMSPRACKSFDSWFTIERMSFGMSYVDSTNRLTK